jgi:hypothetical protein
VRNFDTTRIATIVLMIILSLVVIFHLLVLLQVVPFEVVWGGRLQDPAQMLLFETISIAVNLIMLGVVAIKAGILKVKVKQTIIKIALWTMCGVFLLNTVGNLFSNNEMEKLIFTPITLLLSLFTLRLAVSKKQQEVN